ncbi:hypothetical protein TWF506_006982 [Arthrobotrys conoides]|uniref:Uncharacterized protein n=1 Tax=Arthrobotrys conoides TaxID=74498 RepID=A0AAN8NCY6_9PEZI
MKSIIFTNILLAASLLTTGVSGWYHHPHKSIKIIQHCTTEYCNQNVHPPQSYTKTIHKTTKSIVTITPKPSTRYITQKDKTKTVTKRHTKTYTVTSKCSTRTVYASTVVTATRTISQTKTVTISITVATVTPDSTVVPVPPGFISAGDDPDNQYTLPVEKRDLEARHKKTPYPTSIKCTKTIQTIYKHTVTAKRSTATITKPCKTKTKTIQQTKKITKTIYQQKPKTTTITRIISTSTITKTKTSTKTVTKRVTALAPRVTTYLACGPHNHFQGPSGSVDVVVLPSDLIVPAEIAADCCSRCHEHVNAQGVPDCAGSYFRFPTGTSQKGVCRLRLTNVCSYDNHLRFKPSQDALVEVGQVGNGPCGRWKVQF